MAIRFEDKERDGKSARKDVNGKTYVAEEPAPAPSDPAGQQGTAKKKPTRTKPGSTQPA